MADQPAHFMSAARIAVNNTASNFAKHIMNAIRAHEMTLDNAHEVGARLVSFGQAVVFHLKEIQYADPSLIFFSGETENGQPVTLIQHISQISVLLMTLP